MLGPRSKHPRQNCICVLAAINGDDNGDDNGNEVHTQNNIAEQQLHDMFS